MNQFRLFVVFVSMLVSGAVIAQDAAQKAVLVTGASSGSGRVIAETLAERGYFVYAGARKQADIDELNAIENIQAVRLDVTIQSEIDAAVEFVKNEGRGLYGLVNNAGVGDLGPLIEIEESQVDFIFDVNVMGPYRVTKAFAPLIIDSKGRITTIGSRAGILTRTFYGPYSMSKHAMEAFTDALTFEMDKFDVKVTIIDPSGFKSKIGEASFKRMQDRGFKIEDSLYREEWEAMRMFETEGKINIENDVPEQIANAVIDTLESENPQPRYLTVGSKEAAVQTIEGAMRKAVQVNQGHKHSISRDEMIEILDGLIGATQ